MIEPLNLDAMRKRIERQAAINRGADWDDAEDLIEEVESLRRELAQARERMAALEAALDIATKGLHAVNATCRLSQETVVRLEAENARLRQNCADWYTDVAARADLLVEVAAVKAQRATAHRAAAARLRAVKRMRAIAQEWRNQCDGWAHQAESGEFL